VAAMACARSAASWSASFPGPGLQHAGGCHRPLPRDHVGLHAVGCLGRPSSGHHPVAERAVEQREMQIIASDLYATAVRVSG
jgi:hypothetical protein